MAAEVYLYRSCRQIMAPAKMPYHKECFHFERNIFISSKISGKGYWIEGIKIQVY